MKIGGYILGHKNNNDNHNFLQVIKNAYLL